MKMKIDVKNAWLCLKLGLFVLLSFLGIGMASAYTSAEVQDIEIEDMGVIDYSETSDDICFPFLFSNPSSSSIPYYKVSNKFYFDSSYPFESYLDYTNNAYLYDTVSGTKVPNSSSFSNSFNVSLNRTTTNDGQIESFYSSSTASYTYDWLNISHFLFHEVSLLQFNSSTGNSRMPDRLYDNGDFYKGTTFLFNSSNKDFLALCYSPSEKVDIPLNYSVIEIIANRSYPFPEWAIFLRLPFNSNSNNLVFLRDRVTGELTYQGLEPLPTCTNNDETNLVYCSAEDYSRGIDWRETSAYIVRPIHSGLTPFDTFEGNINIELKFTDSDVWTDPPMAFYDFPSCTADDENDILNCQSSHYARGIEYKINSGEEVYILTPETKFSGAMSVRVKFSGSSDWGDAPIFGFLAGDVPCYADYKNGTVICSDYTDIFFSTDFGGAILSSTWNPLEEINHFTSIVAVGYKSNLNALSEHLVVIFDFEGTYQVAGFVDVNMDVLRCAEGETGFACDIFNYTATVIETALGTILGLISSSFDVFFPFDFNLSEGISYCAVYGEVPHPISLDIPSFSTGSVSTGSGEINVGSWFDDTKFCVSGANNEVVFDDEFGGGDMAIYFLMMVGYYGLFFRTKREYGDIQEKIILPKMDD